MEMEPRPLDPYEQQLLKVFDSYDHDNRGSLDRDGLTQLCHTLQLEEQGTELIRCLLKEPQRTRATFPEFKDALLALLGNMQNNTGVDKGSPDREVSPKFVYGSKKYGRRSRPRSEDFGVDVEGRKTVVGAAVPVQRSSSQSDVSYSKKRKTNYKLKRCTSFPGNNSDFELQKGLITPPGECVCTEEMLREAWNQLGVGRDGFLNQTELVLVCDAIGLHKLAKSVLRQLSDKLLLDFHHKISFQELLEILQQDDTWSEVLNSTPPPPPQENTLNLDVSHDSCVLANPQITLGPEGNGTINTDLVVEMWECAGITSPKLLLTDLGFNGQQINIAELASVLDKEIKGINDTTDYSNPHITLLQANLTLYQTEIRCLKNILEQMCAEREKLKGDVAEANNRATLLAQEVDDNHARMERNTQNQVKLLEQRHSDILKEMNEQFANEKEQAGLVNQTLQQKIACLEGEEAKLRGELLLARNYTVTLERDNQSLNDQIVELQQVKSVLTDQITSLEGEKQKYMEIEQIEPLLAKLSALQVENSQLRDRNDEMVSEIECLSNQINVMRAKVSSTPTFGSGGGGGQHHEHNGEGDISIICEGVGLGAKRRNDESPSKDIGLLGLGDGSPRLGKVRKFHSRNRDLLDVPFTSSESGFDTEIDCCDSSLSISGTEAEEVARLQAKVGLLEQLLKQHAIAIPNNQAECCDDATSKLKQLTERCERLERALREVKSGVSRMLTKTDHETNYETLKSINDKLERLIYEEKCEEKIDASTETDFEDVFRRFEEEKKELVAKCAELESCIELLKGEYEKCEDYWASKLDEERQMFDQEQAQHADKLNELIAKVTEYEEQFALQDNRLPPIEEKDLEKQFTDLEQEFEDYKENTEFQLEEKNKEIEMLKQLMENVSLKTSVAVQVDVVDEKLSNLSNHVVESTNLFSADAMPFGWTPSSESPESLNVLETTSQQQPEQNQPFLWNKEKLQGISATSTPCRPKRTRRCERQSVLYKKTNHERVVMKGAEEGAAQLCTLPIGTVHSLNGRLHHLEQRCRHLQMVLKQQHYYAEQMLQHCWQQHRGEKAELQFLLKSSQEKLEQQVKICNHQLEQLARTDMLVKDLYVENSYLIANVQRLEQQCHLLAQTNSNSCSV